MEEITVFSDQQKLFMNRAIEKAREGLGLVGSNPLVGALLVKKDTVIGSGAHLKWGEAHAEVNAIQSAGSAAKGSDLYVTLEPCSHMGKTPPCADLIIKTGIKRLFVAMVDPNPLVSGQGIEKIRQAGIEVSVGLCQKEALELNQPFIKCMLLGKSYLFLKAAVTLDGKLATASGQSRWISNDLCRERVDFYRASFNGVLCGGATLLADNPSLTIRSPKYQFADQPFRIFVIGNPSEIPQEYQVIQSAGDGKTIFFCSDKYSNFEAVESFKEKGVQFFFFKRDKISFDQLLTQTAKLGINSIMLEGGGSLISSAVSQLAIDGGELFVAPILLGDDHAVSILKGFSPSVISDGYELKNAVVSSYGNNASFKFINHFYGEQ